MLINEKTGSYGMFSRAGRNSTEKFHILMKKDDILNGTGKKFKPPDLFSQAKEEAMKYHIENQDEIQEIFLDENIEDKPKEKKTKKKPDKIFQYKKSDMYMEKFLELRNKTKLLNMVPSCTKYDPKNEFLWKRSKQFPTWDSTLHKTKSKKMKEKIDPVFYLQHEFKIEGKNFVDLAKQTNRKFFVNIEKNNTEEDYFYSEANITNNNYSKFNNRIDNKTERKSIKSANILRKKNQASNLSGVEFDDFSNLTRKTNNFGNNTLDNNGEDNNYSARKENSPSQKSVSSLIRMKKKSFVNKFEITGNNMRSSRSANPLTSRRWIKIQAPDFKKVISREMRERIYDDKKRVMPFSIPPYEKTRPRSIMLVKYDAAKHKPRNDNRPTSTPSIEINFDPYKLLNKVNNHKKPSTPNFRLMTSRPEDRVLPSYMKKLHSRQGADMLTDKALEMNKFADGRFAQTQTCFWPKKSFNKIVNLNLLSSKKFVENVGLNQETNKAKLNEVNDYIEKSMKFYNKNFDDLIKESMLNKFDNITYKHIRKENKLETGDLDKFLLNFENIDI